LRCPIAAPRGTPRRSLLRFFHRAAAGMSKTEQKNNSELSTMDHVDRDRQPIRGQVPIGQEETR
jgi:hypothetical protein